MRILIVEDEVPIAEALCETLKKNEYLVDVCTDGELGVIYANSGIYDLIIVDLMLPKKSGIDVIKEIRIKNKEVKIIILSAKCEDETKVIGLTIGADDYVTKPFSSKELVARIKASLRRRGEVIKNILEFTELSFDLDLNELSYKGKIIKLKNKEIHLMRELMFANGSVVSKEKIFDKVWGFDFDGDYNVIEVYITFLRKKLKALSCNIQIKVSRGLGYYLEIDNG